MKNPYRLGLADLTSKNSARDFMERANEKSKQKMNLNRNLTSIADYDVDIYQEKKKNEKEFKQFFKEFDKEMRAYDKKKEEAFFKAYKEKEKADDMTRERDQSFERVPLQETLFGDGQSSSTLAYKSATNSRKQSSMKPKRPNIGMSRDLDTSSRVSRTAGKSAKKELNAKDGKEYKNKGKDFNIIND